MVRGLLVVLFVTLCAPASAKSKRAKPQEIDAAVQAAKVHVAAATELPPEPAFVPPSPHNLGVTVSGGVSLGVYQAGFMYVLTEVMKWAGFRMSLFTGASAGSANSLISAVNSCLPANPNPVKDLGFQVWMGIGYDEMFDPERVSSISVFNRDPLIKATEKVRLRLADGLRADCDVVIGIATTRAEARVVELAPGLSVPAQDEKLVVRIRGQGRGHAPIIENYVDPRSHVEQPLLPLRELRHKDDFTTALRNFDYVVDAVFASMSFPIAFEPKELQFCYAQPSDPNEALVDRPTCDAPQRRERFVDGGVYDNNPLRLAHNIATQGLRVREDGEVFWRDPVSPPALWPPYEGLQYLFVDPDTPAYPLPHEAEGADDGELVSQTIGLVADFVETSRSRELYELLRSNAALKGKMRLSKRHYPTVSEHLYAFLGFFERDFRLFDYYLGMYDGLVTARSYLLSDAYGDLQLNGVLHDGKDFRKPWKPFACMLGWFEAQYQDYRVACDGPELRNFRILLQIALNRIYSSCSKLTPSEMGTYYHEHCDAASRRNAPPHIAGVRRLKDWSQGQDSEFDYTLRLLTAYQFEFKDMGLSPAEAHKGRYRLRRRLLALIDAIAEAQSSIADRTALLTVGRSAVNEIAYESPDFYGYAVVGSAAEAGLSWTPFDWEPNWLRLNFALQAKGLFAALTLDGTGLQLTPMLGPEFEIYPLTSSFVQPIVGARGGYQFSTIDDFKFGDCSQAAAVGDERRCSQAIAEAYFALTFVERLRFQLVGEIYAESFSFDDRRYNLLLGVGAHFF